MARRTTENCGTCGRLMKKVTLGGVTINGAKGRFVFVFCYKTSPRLHFSGTFIFVPKGERI